jgi:hypothetical protein
LSPTSSSLEGQSFMAPLYPSHKRANKGGLAPMPGSPRA